MPQDGKVIDEEEPQNEFEENSLDKKYQTREKLSLATQQ